MITTMKVLAEYPEGLRSPSYHLWLRGHRYYVVEHVISGSPNQLGLLKWENTRGFIIREQQGSYRARLVCTFITSTNLIVGLSMSITHACLKYQEVSTNLIA